MFRSIRFVAPAVLLAALCIQTHAEPKENPAAAAMGEHATSPMRVQELAPITLIQTSMRTTYEKMGEVTAVIEALEKAVIEKNVRMSHGMVVFIYQGASPDPTKEFELTIGIPVEPGTAAFDQWEVKDYPAFRCATVLHSGNVRSIGSAYQKLFGELTEKGYQPTGENREYYMYWEGEDSDNNIMLLQVGIR